MVRGDLLRARVWCLIWTAWAFASIKLAGYVVIFFPHAFFAAFAAMASSQRLTQADPQGCRASDSPACTSSASSDPHWAAGQKPTPSSLGPHPQVPPSSASGAARLPEARQPFEHVISLGSSCAIALFLRQQRLRVHAGPFDWIFSSARMVAACLDDDFACFLDPAQYAPLPQQQRLQPLCHGCIIAISRLQP